MTGGVVYLPLGDIDGYFAHIEQLYPFMFIVTPLYVVYEFADSHLRVQCARQNQDERRKTQTIPRRCR